MHGAGNDFVMIDNLSGEIELSAEQVVKLCHRNLGVGADGVILVEAGREGGDCFMNYINADGSFAEMCGNGTRCTADFMVRFKAFDKSTLELDTYGGRKQIKVLENHEYTVNMGAPVFAPHRDLPEASFEAGGVTWYGASMGNPHGVGFYETESEIDKVLLTLGAQLESDTNHFPNKANINFVASRGKNHFIVKTYERGAGPTLACGTGASASFAWLSKLNKTKGKTRLDVPGGALFFEFNEADEILMTGPSAVSFFGDLSV